MADKYKKPSELDVLPQEYIGLASIGPVVYNGKTYRLPLGNLNISGTGSVKSIPAYYFDGINAYTVIPYTSSGYHTFIFPIQIKSVVGTNPTLLSIYKDSDNYLWSYLSNGNIHFQYKNNGVAITRSTSLNYAEAENVAFTFDEYSGSLKFYNNGVLVADLIFSE